MRFLVDNALSRRVAELLTDAGHDAVHVGALGLRDASDPEILDEAARDGRVLVSADTDFGGLLFSRAATKPSVVLLRRRTGRRPDEQAALILDHLDALASELEQGAIVVFDEDRIRVRDLPMDA